MTFSARSLRRQLTENLPYRVAKAEIRRLFAFRAATGRSVTRMRGTDARKAQADLDALFLEILGPRLPGLDDDKLASNSRGKAANG